MGTNLSIFSQDNNRLSVDQGLGTLVRAPDVSPPRSPGVDPSSSISESALPGPGFRQSSPPGVVAALSEPCAPRRFVAPVASNCMPQFPSFNDLPEYALNEVFRLLSASDFQNARLACKHLAHIGRDPSLPAWQTLLQESIRRATHPDQVMELLQQAADKGVLRHVKRLDLSRKDLRSAHVEHLSALASSGHLAALHTVDLSCNQIGDDGARDLKLPNAHTVNLSFNQIGAAGARGLKLPNAHTVDLSWNQIGDDGARGLKLPNAHTVDLSCNQIGDAGARDLKLPSAHTVNLIRNQIGDDGARGLKLPNAHTVNLFNNQIGAAAHRVLQNGHPSTIFHW
jgi:Leucine-rich repeat (LRR) protein